MLLRFTINSPERQCSVLPPEHNTLTDATHTNGLHLLNQSRERESEYVQKQLNRKYTDIYSSAWVRLSFSVRVCWFHLLLWVHGWTLSDKNGLFLWVNIERLWRRAVGYSPNHMSEKMLPILISFYIVVYVSKMQYAECKMLYAKHA